MSNTLIELTVLEQTMDENEVYANELVRSEMSPGERARLAMYCSTIIRMCMGTWENWEND